MFKERFMIPLIGGSLLMFFSGMGLCASFFVFLLIAAGTIPANAGVIAFSVGSLGTIMGLCGYFYIKEAVNFIIRKYDPQ